MPYELKKAKGGYFVMGPSGEKSKEPLSRQKALAQMRALYANENPGVEKTLAEMKRAIQKKK